MLYLTYNYSEINLKFSKLYNFRIFRRPGRSVHFIPYRNDKIGTALTKLRRLVTLALPSGKGPPVPTGLEAGCASELVWTQILEENSFTSVGDRAPVIQSIVWHFTDWATTFPNGNILQPYSFVTADALLEISTAVVSAVPSLIERFSQTLPVSHYVVTQSACCCIIRYFLFKVHIAKYFTTSGK
jgi:hypothetical protein